MTATLAPRGHAKTTIMCFLVPLYQALVHPDSYRYYLNVQATSTKAKAINLSIRTELENNDLLRQDYGDQVNADKWTEKMFVLKNGVVFGAISAGESMRGLQYKSKRPDYIIVDDLYDEDDINHHQRIAKKNRWVWGSLYPARDKEVPNCTHFLGTAVSRSDILHTLMKQEGVKGKRFKAVIDWEKKQTLWQDFDSLLKDKKRMGSVIFNREYQNEVRDDDTSIIKEPWIQYYNGTIPLDQEIEKVILTVDPAIGEKSTNDPTAKVLIFKTPNAYYIDSIWNDRFSFNKNVTHIKRIFENEAPDIVRIEAISAFQAITQELKRTGRIPVQEVTAVKDKITRLENISPHFENLRVFFNRNIPKNILDEAVEQLITNQPEHDDIRDAIVLALEEHKREFHFSIV